MEGFPVGAIFVPVESGSDARLPNLKVVAQLVNDFLKSLRSAWVLGNQVSPFVPRQPFTSTDILLLEVRHFFHELVVQLPVIFGAKELGNDDNIVMFERKAVVRFAHGRSNLNSQSWANKSACRVKGCSVATSAFLGHATFWILTARIRGNIGTEIFVWFDRQRRRLGIRVAVVVARALTVVFLLPLAGIRVGIRTTIGLVALC